MTTRSTAVLTNWFSWIHKALFITHSDTPAWWCTLISQLISHNRWWCTFFKPVHRNEKCWHILACFGQFWLWCRERTHFWRTFYRQWCDNKYQVCLIWKSITKFWFVVRRPPYLHDVHIAQHLRSRDLNVQNIGGTGIPGVLMCASLEFCGFCFSQLSFSTTFQI